MQKPTQILSAHNYLLLTSDTNRIDIIRSPLINEVIKPVCEHQRAYVSPGHNRLFCRIIIGKIVVGHLDVESLIPVTEVLLCKGIGIVLRMSRCIEVSALKVGNKVNSGLIGIRQNLQILAKRHIVKIDVRMA